MLYHFYYTGESDLKKKLNMCMFSTIKNLWKRKKEKKSTPVNTTTISENLLSEKCLTLFHAQIQKSGSRETDIADSDNDVEINDEEKCVSVDCLNQCTWKIFTVLN